MRKGPGPFQPTIACESPSLLWHSEIQESMTAVVALLSMMQRRDDNDDWPWMYVRSRTRLFAVVAALFCVPWFSPSLTMTLMLETELVVPISTPVRR